MLSSYFGVGLLLTDNSSTPAVTINRNGGITLIDTAGDSMRYRFGTPNQATIDWRGIVPYDEGKNPTVANNSIGVIEVHNSGSSGHEKDFWWNTGLYSPQGIDWKGHFQKYNGTHPSVAMMDSGATLVVHEDPDDSSKLSYIATFLGSDGIAHNFTVRTKFEQGTMPSVALTEDKTVLLAFERNGQIWTSVGFFDGANLTMNPATAQTKGSHPAVGLTQEGYFVIAFQKKIEEGPALLQLSGTVRGTSVAPASIRVFAVGGTYPTVSAYDKLAVQVNQGPKGGIFFSTSRVEDRDGWMQEYLPALGGRTLRNLVMPASHDAAMYRTPKGTGWIAQTQKERILRQLNDGIRWFDLRLTRYLTGCRIVTHHGAVPGPPLQEVLADVRAFIEHGNRELIVLKFSHFSCDYLCSYDDAAYQQTVGQVITAVGPYLYKTPLATGTTLGEVTLQEYLSAGACVLVLVDGDYAIRFPTPGFWIYRDEDNETDVAKGQLRVYDHYSDTEDFDKMRVEQWNAFAGFTGTCSGDKASTCDLFLLSWTLTPGKPSTTHFPTPVLKLAVRADSQLGASAANPGTPIPNFFGRIVNLVYVDYCELARATDVALYLNGV